MFLLAGLHGVIAVTAWLVLRRLIVLRPWRPVIPVVMLGLALQALGVFLMWHRELQYSLGRPIDMFGGLAFVASAISMIGWLVWISSLRPRGSFRAGVWVALVASGAIGVLVHVVASARQLPIDDPHGPDLADATALVVSMVLWPFQLADMAGMMSS